MNIKQLNKLIQEELKAYLREEEEEMDMDMGDEEGDDIEVTTDEEPEDEAGDALDTLRQIYDMLTPIVGGEEEEMEDIEGEEEEGEEDEEEGEEEEEEIDEAVDNHTFFRGDNVNRTRVDAKDVQGRREKVNESMLRMQKLAGLITESDIKKKLSLNEFYDPEPAKQSDWDDADPPEAFGFTVEIYATDSDDNDGAFNFSAPEVEVFFDTMDDFDSNEEAKAHFNKLFDPSQEDMWYEFIEREAREIGIRDFEYEGFQPMIIR